MGTPMSEALNTAVSQLQSAGIASARLDAHLLLAHVLQCSREALLLNAPALTPQQHAAFEARLARRLLREPLSHITRTREFYGHVFTVTKDVLDPRPDSETLIETCIRLLPNPPPATTVLDIGTGSGCLLLTLLMEWPQATGIGVDISPAALTIAKENAEKLGLSARCVWKEMDLAALTIAGPIDLIISNPPYIPSAEIPTLMPEVARFEPRLALDGGKDGLDCYRKLAKQVHGLLAPAGAVVLEFGSTQADDIAGIMRGNGLRVEAIVSDLAGHPRCMVIRRAQLKP